MRVMVEVRWGKASGKKAVIEPGTTLRIGRVDTRCDFAIEHDRQLSGIHCEVAWDGTRAVLRDKQSRLGTMLNGERVTEALLANGDWIKAADTNLMVYFEEHTPPKREADIAMTEVKEKALAGLEAETEPLFAVLDAARNNRILELLRESVEEHRSLYEGVKGDVLEDKAPYLVRLPKGTRLLRKLVAEGWGKRWGIYLTSKRPFREVRMHLRRFLMVKDDETDKRIYFRFCDPGAFRVVWPTTTVRQKAYFFADMGAVLFEDQDGAVTRVVAEGAGCEGTWRIRKGQMVAIGRAIGIEEFEVRMAQRLREFAPYSLSIGERQVRRVIRLGVERAKPYGITNPGLLRLYVDMMAMYGSFFDADPFLPWAGKALRDESVLDARARMDWLHATMLQYFGEVSGPRRAFDWAGPTRLSPRNYRLRTERPKV